MLGNVTGFLATFKYWLIAILILVPASYMKGCSDGGKRVEARYNKVSVDIQSKARSASETASAQKELRDITTVTQTEELRNDIQTKTGEPVGTNTRRVLDGMRSQQSSGSNKTTD